MTGANGTSAGPMPGEGSSLGSPLVSPARVDAWLAELGIAPRERAERDRVTSWDVLLDGRQRPGVLVTLILDPSLALVCWVHYAPPIKESFRISYRMLLRWNDELPFVKFAVSEDERPVLTTELPVATLDLDALGVALARLLAVCDLLLADSSRWLEAPGTRKGKGAAGPPVTPSPLLERYADRLGELATTATIDDAGDDLAEEARSAPASTPRRASGTAREAGWAPDPGDRG